MNARKGLVQATEIAPGEPAGWLNLGLLQFRQQDFEGAYQSVARALTLVAGNSRVEALLGVIESRRGKEAESIKHLTRAVELDGHNLKAAFALVNETERQNSPAADEMAQRLLENILAVQPNNLAVLLDDVRLAAKRGDGGRVKSAVAKLGESASMWPEAGRQQLSSLQTSANGNVRGAAMEAQFLKNVLVRAPAYRQSLDEVRTPATSAGEPFLRFFKLPSPRSEPDEADRQLRFEAKAISGVSGRVRWLGTMSVDNQSNAVPVWVDESGLRVNDAEALPFPPQSVAITPYAVSAADFNYDFKTDLAVASSAGLRLFLHDETNGYRDATAAMKLSTAVTGANYTGAWAFDVDLDGDLDLVLGAPAGAPTVLRNNGDGSFAVAHPFAGVDGVTGFASADVDGDGDPDVALIDGRRELHVYANERLGDYRQRPLPETVVKAAAALSAADVNGDGLADFVVLQRSGTAMRLSDASAGKDWTTALLANAKPAESLLLADLDNNGALDLVVGSEIFLGDGKSLTALEGGQKGAIAAAVDLDGNGRLALLTLRDGAVSAWSSRGTKKYHWQTVRPLAAHTNGDQRMNSFGVGGEIEVRADLLTQKQIIQGPNLHFGLGSHGRGTEFARIGWPNGLIQTEFNLKPDHTLVAEQRLKGSCPYLFAWDGTAMRFLKDVAPMSAALGGHAADGSIAPPTQTRQWFSMRGDQVRAQDGLLRLRITDEYWESYFLDQYELTAVDHPQGTQVFVDERVPVPTNGARVYVTETPRDFASVGDELFLTDTYAGVGREHELKLVLPQDAPKTAELYLIAQGSLRPWDDSTLVALNQSRHAKPRDLSLEAQADGGEWRLVNGHLGVPAGRFKTVVVQIPKNASALRLRTNLAIYWSSLKWARSLPDKQARLTKLRLASATLDHRGFSAVTLDRATGIENPEYTRVAGSGERWPALAGNYTRFGDVRALLAEADSRYVIATSGDELQLAFEAGPQPTAADERDYVFAGDGWIKEGDYSFHGSQALMPLPYQGLQEYGGISNGLESERAYRLHPNDWDIFHTRYVAGSTLRSSLWR